MRISQALKVGLFCKKDVIQIARSKYHVTLACDVMLGAKKTNKQMNGDDCGKAKK